MPTGISTRGFGLLERALARRRGAVADGLIPEDLRGGTIIDLGSGAPPAFLAGIRFARKIAIDARAERDVPGVRCIRHRVAAGERLPLDDASADVVTMLAFVEHLPEERFPAVLADARRILKPRGMIVVTTPSPRAEGLLRLLAGLGLVSREEIGDHKRLYGSQELAAALAAAGFDPSSVRCGAFECGLNQWMTASA